MSAGREPVPVTGREGPGTTGVGVWVQVPPTFAFFSNGQPLNEIPAKNAGIRLAFQPDVSSVLPPPPSFFVVSQHTPLLKLPTAAPCEIALSRGPLLAVGQPMCSHDCQSLGETCQADPT